MKVSKDCSKLVTMRTLFQAPLLIAVLLFASCTTLPGSELDRVDTFVRAEMERQKVPGVAVAVMKNGRVAKAAGYGFSNLEHKVPAGPETVFQSGSLGKQFTAVAVMLQVRDGKLRLDDSITKFLTGAPTSWQSITVRNLLTHTSGIPDYDEDMLDLRRDYSEDDFAKFAYGLQLEFPAGSRWSYSNTGYVLLGIIVHKVSGRFYGDVLRERVFEPLGMKSARVISEEDIVPNRAAGYRLVKGELKNQEWVSPSVNTTADGSLYLTLSDFVAWDAGLRAKAILTPEEWAQVFEPVRLNSGKTYPYGFGWFVDDFSGQRRQHHSGEWQGFETYISRYLGDDLTVVVLCNLAGAQAERFVDGIAATYNPKLATPPLVPIPDLEPQTAAKLATLLAEAATGRLVPEAFAYVPTGFFPKTAARYRELLHDLGPVIGTELLYKRQLGDDWVSRYRAVFTNKRVLVTLGLAPDTKISQFSLREEQKP
jgi:CubicO group peptidase (beta-lactamase class C family)